MKYELTIKGPGTALLKRELDQPFPPLQIGNRLNGAEIVGVEHVLKSNTHGKITAIITTIVVK